MTTDLSTGASHEPVASCATAFACLLRLGTQASAKRERSVVRCRRIVDGDSLPLSRLVELVGELGFKAERSRLDWYALQSMAVNHSLLALLNDTNLVMVTGAGGSGTETVAIWDPLDRYDRVHLASRQNFESLWTGDVVVIARQPFEKIEAADAPDFCWLTPAGLQLLRRTSGKRKDAKVLDRTPEEAGVQRSVDGRETFIEEQAQATIPALTGRGERRRFAPIIQFSLAVAVILAIVGTGMFLLGHPVVDSFAIASDVSKEPPNSGSSTDQVTAGDADRLAQAVPPLAQHNEEVTRNPNMAPSSIAREQHGPHEADAESEAGVGTSSAPRNSAAPVVPSAREFVSIEGASSNAAPARPASPDEPILTTGLANPAAVASAVSISSAVATVLGSAQAEPFAESRLSAAEVFAFLGRGGMGLSIGDVAWSQPLYERAAEAGAGLAALRLGQTSHPAFPDRVHLRGVPGDKGDALSWYNRVLDLDVTDAEVLANPLQKN